MKEKWQRTPRHIRRPIVLVVGGFFVILSALTGWLPGPGGIPLFLIGIAILASEFTWAERFRDWVFGYVFAFGRWLRRHWVWTMLFTITYVTLAVFAYQAYVK